LWGTEGWERGGYTEEVLQGEVGWGGDGGGGYKGEGVGGYINEVMGGMWEGGRWRTCGSGGSGRGFRGL